MMLSNSGRRLFQITLSAAILLLAACGKTTEKPGGNAGDQQAEFGGTIIYGKNGPPITLDPAFVEETESSIIVCNVFEGLVIQRAGKIAIDPGLAKSWKISLDGKTYTFLLRPGLTFHDGTPVNAEAVVFSFDRQRSNQPTNNQSGYALWNNFNMVNILREIRAVNDSVVEIQLKAADATFLNVLSLNFLSVISPTAFKKMGDDFAKAPVGAGPFRFQKWDEDGSVTLTAFEGYWNERPYIDTLVFRPIPNAHERWQALKNGNINMMGVPDQKDLPEIEKTPGIHSAQQPGTNVAYLGMNMNKKPFDNIKVREAINCAIDRDKLVKAVFAQLGRPAKNPLPPTLLGYNEEIHPVAYDPARGRQLLAEAGFPKGFKCKFWGLPIVRDYMPNPQLAAEMIIADLKAVGIEAELVIIPSWGEFLKRRGHGEHEMSLSGWVGDAPDPHFFFYPLLDKDITTQKSSTNVSYYKSEEMHRLITRGKQTFDPIERSNIYKKGCELFNKDLPWFTIAHAVTIVPMRDYVMNFQLHASATKRFEKVWIKK